VKECPWACGPSKRMKNGGQLGYFRQFFAGSSTERQRIGPFSGFTLIVKML